jgi:predicted ester cyclase
MEAEMSEATKATARRWFDEVINARQPEMVDEIFAPDYVHHDSRGGSMRREQIKQFVAELLAAYPDRTSTVHDLIADGDKVAVYWSSTGHRHGGFQGRPATGARETATGMWIARVEGDRLVEGWEIVDLGIRA